MTLTTEEIVLIGGLAKHQGFQALVKALKAEEDMYLSLLEQATTDAEDHRLSDAWRAYRRVVTRLQTVTKTFEEYADAAFNGLNPEIPELDALE